MQHNISDQSSFSSTPARGIIPVPHSEEQIAQPLSADQLQKRITWYAGLGIVVISLIIASISLVPFYQHLREDASETLALKVSTRTVAIEAHLVRVSDIAAQIASRTRMREELIAYNQGELSRAELVELSEPKLADAMNQSDDIAGLLRLDQQGQPTLQAGMEIPQETWSFVSDQGTLDSITLSDPIWIDDTPYLVIATPIESATETVGTDISIFDLSHMQQLVLDTSDIGAGSTALLGTIGDNEEQVFFSSEGESSPSQARQSIVAQALQHAEQQKQGLLDAQGDSSKIVSYQVLEHTSWVFAIVADKDTLYTPAYYQVGMLIVVIVSMLLLGTLGITLLLRPLTGHVVMRAGTLEQEVAEKTASLQVKIEERNRAEQELRIFCAMAENAPDIVGLARLDTSELTYTNPAYYRLLGYEQSVIGTHLTDVFAEEPEYLMSLIESAIAHGSWSGVVSYRRADGGALPTFLTGFIVRDEAENPIAIAGIARDISEQLRVEAERDALQQQVIDAQRATISELSTPLLPLAEHIVAMPLVGTLDTARAQQVMETLLEGIAHHQASIAIIDITGIKIVDTQVAQALIRTAQAVRLLGTRVILTGIQPQIAQTLVHLGVELHGIVTQSTLQAGIAYALKSTR